MPHCLQSASHRIVKLAAAAALALSLLPALAGTPTAGATPAAPAPADYRAQIRRTEHGIPHIKADDFGSLGFGSGYATAETSICTLAETLLAARGELSRWLGPDQRYRDEVTLDATNLQVDAFVTDLRNRRVVEKLLADSARGPSEQARQMVEGFTSGVNRYLAAVGPDGVTDPACRGADYLRMRAEPIDLWYGVYLANLLASAGVFVKEIVDAEPPLATDPLPEEPEADDVDKGALLRALGRDPEAPFGSNATAVGGDATTTGRGMILGNPHFPWRGRYRFTQQHLEIPGEYEVAGASLVGSPVVNIGWNHDVAWSHTVSTAYRFTPYEYRLVAPTTYLTESGPKKLQRRVVDVEVRRPDGSLETVREDVWATDEGFVLDSQSTLMPWTPASVWAIRDANAEHLRTIDVFLEMGRADSVRDLLDRQDEAAGMPWVNTIAADRAGDVLYADHSVVPNVPDDMAEVCMTPVGRVLEQVAGLPGLDGTRAASDCEWRTDADSPRPGVFGPSKLPHTFRRDWVANANDSHWLPNPDERLEGYAGIIGCERCERSLRTRLVYRYVQDRLAGRDEFEGTEESPETLAASEHLNRVFAAELMREGGDLDTVCTLAVGSSHPACEVLRSWDGRSDIDSVGNHIFEEFVSRLPAEGVWTVPFSAEGPLTTPRDLNEANPLVVKAMRDAVAALEERGVPFDAEWGSLHVAGDRGAPPIAVGGGEGTTGNANVTVSRRPVQNADHDDPVTYGSSHIQSVAFLPDGGMSIRTMLSYGQSEDPTSPWSADQTRLFSQERWVAFPWTDAQIGRQLVSNRTITSP